MAKQAPEAQEARAEASRQFAIEAARLASATRCHNVVVLNVENLSPVSDFLVIATGTSPRQMRTVCDQIEELAEPRGYRRLSQAGYEGESWILVDFFDVLIHIFSEDARQFYDLDTFWGDAPRIEWRPAEVAT